MAFTGQLATTDSQPGQIALAVVPSASVVDLVGLIDTSGMVSGLLEGSDVRV